MVDAAPKTVAAPKAAAAPKAVTTPKAVEVEEAEVAPKKKSRKSKGKTKAKNQDPDPAPPKEVQSEDSDSDFQIITRKTKGILSKPTDAFTILKPEDNPPINFYSHVVPFGKHTPDQINKWLSKPRRKVLATVIGAFRPIGQSFPYSKTTSLITRAAAFVATGRSTTTAIPDSDWTVLECKNDTIAKALVKARLVLNYELNVVVLFREVIKKYRPGNRCITICHIANPTMYAAWEKVLKNVLHIDVSKVKNKRTQTNITIDRPQDNLQDRKRGQTLQP